MLAHQPSLHASAILRTLSTKPLRSRSVIEVATVVAVGVNVEEETMVDVVKHLAAMISTYSQRR
jgi:hypothetical protein